MKTFEFSVIASGLDPSADDFETQFYENGCDDALVSFQKGHIIIDFAREAETMDDAISSALGNVAAAGRLISVNSLRASHARHLGLSDLRRGCPHPGAAPRAA